MLGGITTHQLRRASGDAPSARRCDRVPHGYLRSVDLPYGRQETTVNLAAAGALYTKLCEATEGYAGAVPVFTRRLR